ncbi:type VI secretion system baseplate subunit TssK, partial [Salmonella enterica]|uniref:type VI secretion system baseplate subunit TssK n=1 Tax=Salmonella enterica TaxID=28901 RepID=UPI0020C3CDC3
LDVRKWDTREFLGRLRPEQQSGSHEEFACIPHAHIQECRADRLVTLDERFIPTVLNSRHASRLATFLTELQGLLHQRGEALAARA